MINEILETLKNRPQKGTSMVFFSILMVVFMGMVSLVVDIGNLVAEKAKLSAAVDAAALAGAQELISNSGNAEYISRLYLDENIKGIKNIQISAESSNKRIKISADKTIDYFFARIFNINSVDISQVAKAKVENIVSLKGSRPLAVVQQVFTYGKVYTLKEGAGDGYSGNYAAISLGGSGASIYRYNMLNGYSGVISVGDIILTETGNISGATETSIKELLGSCTHTPVCTYNNYNPNCAKILLIPVVNTLEINGRKYIQVVGFATFFLDGVTSSGGQADVIGRFITYNMSGETANNIGDFGTYGIKLYR